jgi:magnesium-transporting ATPase (P-type)
MVITDRELWTVIHGMLLGAIFFMAFSGIWVSLWSLHPERTAGVVQRVRGLKIAGWATAIILWLTVFTGTYIVYPWYRAKPPEGADLTQFPRSYLLASPDRAGWHNFGMEWKEHVAWLAPILVTAVAYIISRYGVKLVEEEKIRKAVILVFTIALIAALAAVVFGAFLNKAAPIK